MDNNIKVSVLIPVYNVENFMKKCLDSAINQTLKDIEIICVNDASTDKSLDILNEYEKKDSRIRIIDLKENHGLGAVRNISIDEAKGEYIMFLDTDDWIEPDACEKAYNQIKKNNNDFAFFNLFVYYEEEDSYIIDSVRLSKFKDAFDNNIDFSKLDYPFFGNGECWYKIYKREFLKENNIRFATYRMGEDLPFYAKLITCSKSASILNEPLYYYRIGKHNTIKKALYDDLLQSQKAAFEIICNSNNSQIYKKYYTIAYINSLISWFYIWKRDYRNIEKDFYNKIRNVFISLNEQDSDKYAFSHLSKKNQNIYKKIIKYNYFIFALTELPRNTLPMIFSIRNSDGKKYKYITILGLKIKFKK